MLQAAADLRVAPRAVERWLTVGEVADRLRVSTATVYTLCKRGELPHVRLANAIRISERTLDDLIRART